MELSQDDLLEQVIAPEQLVPPPRRSRRRLRRRRDLVGKQQQRHRRGPYERPAQRAGSPRGKPAAISLVPDLEDVVVVPQLGGDPLLVRALVVVGE